MTSEDTTALEEIATALVAALTTTTPPPAHLLLDTEDAMRFLLMVEDDLPPIGNLAMVAPPSTTPTIRLNTTQLNQTVLPVPKQPTIRQG